MQTNKMQSGVVSIFIVIFSALFLTIVTVTFVGIMIRSQIQTRDSDLNSSAYDSAIAGVEDAKRLMLSFRNCESTNATTPFCNQVRQAMSLSGSSKWTECNSVKVGLFNGGSSDNSEYLIQRSVSSNDDLSLNQAYTCVKIRYSTQNIESKLIDGQQKIIPLETNGQNYKKIRLSWYKKSKNSNKDLGFYNNLSSIKPDLPKKSDWNQDASRDVPALIRLQFIQVGANLDLNSFEDSNNTNTVFYYPSNIGSASSNMSTEDIRNSEGRYPKLIRCNSSSFNNGGYACSVTIELSSLNGGEARKEGFLNIGAIYKDSDYKVELLDDNDNIVELAGVQPEVDSTGRANDIFRRVNARVEFIGDFKYPSASLDVKSDLCKNFGVSTRSPNDYSTLKIGECNPFGDNIPG